MFKVKIVTFVIKKSSPINVSLFRLSSNAATSSSLKFDQAKKFSQIPGPHLYQLMGPFGKYSKLPFDKMIKQIYDDYGTIFKFPGFLGMKPLVYTFLPEDIEKVHRTEGKFPHRRVLDSTTYFRQKYRPDLYPAGAGIINVWAIWHDKWWCTWQLINEHPIQSQGQEWYDLRTKIQQILMKPKVAKSYVPKIDSVARDFIKK